MSHDIKDHKTLEEVLQNRICWEDYDSFLIIGLNEDGSFCGTKFWKQDISGTSDSLLELAYEIYGPKCYCDEDEK